MRQSRLSVDPIKAIELPLPPDRELSRRYTVELTGFDIRDITKLVFEKLKGARETLRQAPTARQKRAAEDNVRHWWAIYDRLLP